MCNVKVFCDILYMLLDNVISHSLIPQYVREAGVDCHAKVDLND